MNEIEILGNLGKEPEVKVTKNGGCMVRFSVASNRKVAGPNGTVQEFTDWIPCIVWNNLAEAAAKYLTKGKRVFIKGRYNTRKWETPTGETRYINEIVVSHISLPLPVKKDENNQQGQASQSQAGAFSGFGQAHPEPAPQYQEDIPF